MSPAAFLPADLDDLLGPVPAGATAGQSRAAVGRLLEAYSSPARLAAGAGAWLAGVVGSFALPLGVGAAADGDTVLGGTLAVAGAAVLVLAGWLGVRVIRAGGRITAAVRAWARARGPHRPATRGQAALQLFLPLSGGSAPRLVACSLTALLAVLAASLVGFTLGRGGQAGTALAVTFALLTVVNAAAAVPALSGVLRVQQARTLAGV